MPTFAELKATLDAMAESRGKVVVDGAGFGDGSGQNGLHGESRQMVASAIVQMSGQKAHGEKPDFVEPSQADPSKFFLDLTNYSDKEVEAIVAGLQSKIGTTNVSRSGEYSHGFYNAQSIKIDIAAFEQYALKEKHLEATIDGKETSSVTVAPKTPEATPQPAPVHQSGTLTTPVENTLHEGYKLSDHDKAYIADFTNLNGSTPGKPLQRHVQHKLNELSNIEVTYTDGKIDRADLEKKLDKVFEGTTTGNHGVGGEPYSKYVADLMLGTDIPGGKHYAGEIDNGNLKLNGNKIDPAWINLDVVDKLAATGPTRLTMSDEKAAQYLGQVQGIVEVPGFGNVNVQTPAGHERMKDFASIPIQGGYGEQMYMTGKDGTQSTIGFVDHDSAGQKERPDIFFGHGYVAGQTKIYAIDQSKKGKDGQIVFDEPKLVFATSPQDALNTYAQTWGENKKGAMQQAAGVLEFDSPEKYQEWLKTYANEKSTKDLKQFQTETGKEFGHYYEREPNVATQNRDTKKFKEQTDFSFVDHASGQGFQVEAGKNLQTHGIQSAANLPYIPPVTVTPVQVGDSVRPTAGVQDGYSPGFLQPAPFPQPNTFIPSNPLPFRPHTTNQPAQTTERQDGTTERHEGTTQPSGQRPDSERQPAHRQNHPIPHAQDKLNDHINHGEILAKGDGMGRFAASKDDVIAAQEKLNKNFGQHLETDGKYGHDTSEAVREFQKKFNKDHHLDDKTGKLREDGQLGKQTLVAMELEEAQKKVATSKGADGHIAADKQADVAKELKDILEVDRHHAKTGKALIPEELLKEIRGFAKSIVSMSPDAAPSSALISAAKGLQETERGR